MDFRTTSATERGLKEVATQILASRNFTSRRSSKSCIKDWALSWGVLKGFSLAWVWVETETPLI
jgi:hypothetical protein